jgi:hypothetical protein
VINVTSKQAKKKRRVGFEARKIQYASHSHKIFLTYGAHLVVIETDIPAFWTFHSHLRDSRSRSPCLLDRKYVSIIQKFALKASKKLYTTKTK